MYFWLGVGTDEPERMHTSIASFQDAMVRGGIHVQFYESCATAHE